VNPADGLDDEFDWSNGDDDDTDTPCLATEHVRALYNAADDQENRLLVLALCAWGLRPNEVASLRVRQFVLDISTDEVPYITFEERKNGPGEVSLLYGKEVLEDRIANVRRSRGVGWLSVSVATRPRRPDFPVDSLESLYPTR